MAKNRNSGLFTIIIRSLVFGLLVIQTVNATTSKEKDLDSSAKEETSTGKRTVWQPEMDQITCCNGGTPTVPENLVRNFTIIPSDYTIEERTVDDLTMNCRDYEVRYLAQRSPLLSESDSEFDGEIKLKCKCVDSTPAQTLDANCRRLLSCKNNGFRSPTSPHQCICPQPFFGERCEKYCDQGQRLKSHSGRDYCSCVPFYNGDECRDMVCLNGGREENGRCICMQQYLGFHCEINTNHTAGGSRFQRFGDQGTEMFTRDISGTIFSLIMIVVLVVSMYLLMKHRMQTRYLNRRSDLLGACNFPVPTSMTIAGGPGSNGCLSAGRRTELMSPDDPRLYSFRPVAGMLPDSGPPPYFQHRGRRGNRDEVLPPLPSYDDATKLPALRHNISNDDSVELAEETTELSTRHPESNRPTNNDSPQSTQLSPSSENIVATVRGTEMIRPVSSTTQRPIENVVDEGAETASIASTFSSTNSEASSKPEQR